MKRLKAEQIPSGMNRIPSVYGMNSQWNNFGGCAEGSSHPAANKAVLIEALVIKPVVTAMVTIQSTSENFFFKSTQI